ncbi:hypothetical protein PLESTF_000933200 [Pleodorina starrii]|nr:hypothetical protein PLESTM_000987700 [Pleodorina starrii]GLC70168.1 hypothetical protein PLESTF_000933200 [Pleodorina starrii]
MDAWQDPGVPFSTFGTCSYAHRKNTPAYSIGHGEKQRVPELKSVLAAVPGPGSYSVDPLAVRQTGRLVTPSLYANTKWGMDLSPRTNLGLPRQTHRMPPGPGLYLRSHSARNLTGSRQLVSKWGNATRAGWQDYCARECLTPVVLSREHERERFGTHSPGPMTAAPVDSVGKQLNSTRKTQPRCTIGRSERFATATLRAAAAVPGPGAYNY